MKVIAPPLLLLVCVIIVLLGAVYRDEQSRERLILSGSITARFANEACAALSPAASRALGRDPVILNDGKLDEVEERAIEDGCALQAIAISPNGTHLTDVFLVLLRAEAHDGEARLFSAASRTDAQGIATWYFKPTPNTHFWYEVISPNPVGESVRSNRLELRLCTGRESINLVDPALQSEAGRGCAQQ